MYEAGRVLSFYRARDKAALDRLATAAAKPEVAALDFAPADWRTVAIAANRGISVARAEGDHVMVEIAPIGDAEVAVLELRWAPAGFYQFDGFARMPRATFEAFGARL